MQQSIIIDTRAAVIICPDPDKAAEYIRDLLDLGMQRSEGLRFSIETKPTDQVERFLSGGGSVVTEPVKKEPISKMKTKKQAPAPTAKKAASAAKSSRGGDTRELVLEAIRGGADNCSKIAKLTGVSSVTVGSYIKKLATEKNVTVTGAFSSFKVVPYEGGFKPAPTKDKASTIKCPAKDKSIPASKCQPNSGSPVCRKCQYGVFA